MKLTTYEILSTGENCGLVEFIQDAMSIDDIKRKMKEVCGRELDLSVFYKLNFDTPRKYNQAINNLIDSLAAYSLVCYIL